MPCCDVVNRGAAIADGRLFFNTLDNHVIALDAAKGTVVWSVQTVPTDQQYTMTMAPRIAPLSLVYFLLIWLGSVQLGWHYASDGLAGAMGMLAVWRATLRFGG